MIIISITSSQSSKGCALELSNGAKVETHMALGFEF